MVAIKILRAKEEEEEEENEKLCSAFVVAALQIFKCVFLLQNPSSFSLSNSRSIYTPQRSRSSYLSLA